MARRAGKAASRRARQQRRAAHRPTLPPASPAAPLVDAADVEESPAPSREEPRRASAPAASAPSPARAYAATGSSLTARERAEYHYVERDLRNIGILSLVMVGLLILAWFLFTATGLIG